MPTQPSRRVCHFAIRNPHDLLSPMVTQIARPFSTLAVCTQAKVEKPKQEILTFSIKIAKEALPLEPSGSNSCNNVYRRTVPFECSSLKTMDSLAERTEPPTLFMSVWEPHGKNKRRLRSQARKQAVLEARDRKQTFSKPR